MGRNLSKGVLQKFVISIFLKSGANMNKITLPLIITLMAFNTGCGLVARMATPTQHEKIVPAEFDLSEETTKTILVLVDQPPYISAPGNMRYYITNAVNNKLKENLEFEEQYLVEYSDIADFRSSREDFADLSPTQIAAQLNADMVLLIVVEHFELVDIAKSGCYRGAINAQTAMYDTATEQKLWPKDQDSKLIKVGFDVAKGKSEQVTKRLANSFSHCLVRYFYDCKIPKFRILDDRTTGIWQKIDEYK